MPPNTHYLDWLNPHNADQYAQPTEVSSEDISKSLELFTNTTFLDSDSLFNQPFDSIAYENSLIDHSAIQQQSQPLNHSQRATSMTAPRSQRPQFQSIQARPAPEMDNLGYLPQVGPIYPSPLPHKRSAEEADLNYAATPSSEVNSEDNKSANKTLNDEDKRRRNTAASARFRVKKKEREKALQQSAKNTMDRNQQLEQRIKELELENKWLRSLLKPVNAEQSKNVLASL